MIREIRKKEISIWGFLLAMFVFLAPLESFLINQAVGSLIKLYTFVFPK